MSTEPSVQEPSSSLTPVAHISYVKVNLNDITTFTTCLRGDAQLGAQQATEATPHAMAEGELASGSICGSVCAASPSGRRPPVPTQAQLQCASPNPSLTYGVAPIVVPPPSNRVIKKQVARDISKLLASNRAYVQHHRTPPIASAATLQRVSRPKYFGSNHPDSQLQIDDPTDYAKYKTKALRDKREAREAAEAARRDEQAQQLRELHGWQEHMAQNKARELTAKEVAAKEQAKLAQALSRHVTERAKSDLQARRKLVKDQRERAELLHQEALAQFSL